MTQSVVITETIKESGEAEELLNELITDAAFLPGPPLNAMPPAWEEGATYAKNALVSEGGQAYRSQEAANKEHKPSEDADFVHWAPVSIDIVPLQNPHFTDTPAPLKQQAHNNKPPASSAATASAAETIGLGAETPV